MFVSATLFIGRRPPQDEKKATIWGASVKPVSSSRPLYCLEQVGSDFESGRATRAVRQLGGLWGSDHATDSRQQSRQDGSSGMGSPWRLPSPFYSVGQPENAFLVRKIPTVSDRPGADISKGTEGLMEGRAGNPVAANDKIWGAPGSCLMAPGGGTHPRDDASHHGGATSRPGVGLAPMATR